MYQKIIKISIVLLCMICIFVLSGDNASKSNKKSDSTIIFISRFIVGHKISKTEQNRYIEKYVVPVRKGAHFTIYLILGISIISLLYEYKIVDTKAIIIALVISILYACSDEIHQVFVPGRTGKILDVFIDSLGSFMGIVTYYLIKKRRQKHE